MYNASTINKDKVQIMSTNENFITVRAEHFGTAKEFIKKNYNCLPCHNVYVSAFRTVLNKVIYYRAYSFLIIK